MKCTIKLIGSAEILPSGALAIMVAPMLVPQTSPFATVSGATNAVSVTSTNLGNSFLVGPGAGALPTANSVVSDIVDIVKGQGTTPFPKSEDTVLGRDFSGKFYIRFMAKDQLGILHHIMKTCVEYSISVDQVIQIPPEASGWDRACCPFVMLTDKTDHSKVKEACENMATASWNVTPPFFMPVWDPK